MTEAFDAAKLSKRDRALSLGAVYACIFANGIGIGLSLPLSSLLMERNGISQAQPSCRPLGAPAGRP